MPDESIVINKSNEVTADSSTTTLSAAHGGESGPKLRERLVREHFTVESSIAKLQDAANLEDLLSAIEELIDLGALNPDAELQQVISQIKSQKTKVSSVVLDRVKSRVISSSRSKKSSKSNRGAKTDDLVLVPYELMQGASRKLDSVQPGSETDEVSNKNKGQFQLSSSEDNSETVVEHALEDLAEAAEKEEKKEELAQAASVEEEKRVVAEVFEKTGVYVDPNFRVLKEADKPQLIAEALRKKNDDEIV